MELNPPYQRPVNLDWGDWESPRAAPALRASGEQGAAGPVSAALTAESASSLSKMKGAAAVPEFLRQMKSAIAEHKHHDHRRAILIEFLRDGYGIELDEVELEHNVKTDEARGRIDLLYRHLVFEVKRDLEKEDADVKDELRKYLDKTGGDRSVALATDGKRFDAYRLSGDQVTPFASLKTDDVSDQELFDWLDGFLFSQEQVDPSAEDVVRRFGPESAVYASASDLLLELWKRVNDDTSVQLKFAEWDELLRIVYGSPQGSEELFLRHTYLALVARLLAFIALTGQSVGVGDELGIVTGEAFERAGIANFVEADFFGWVEDDEIEDQTRELIQKLSRHLDVYTVGAIDEDLLKHLYEALVDPAERHDLGEYYTPDWLAERTLTDAGFDENTTMLDPACGSGTFLFTAIRLLRKAGLKGKKLVDAAAENLNGFDVHPLAVTVARANFLLALGSDANGRAVSVPVAMANSIAAPTSAFGKPIAVRVSDSESFYLPTEMEDVREGLLDEAIGTAADYAVPEIGDDDAQAGLKAWLQKADALGFEDQWRENLKLLRKLVAENRDTVWRFVLSNAVRPQVMARRPVDLVCGNPPWLPLRDITDRTYQDHVIELAINYGILKDRKGWKTGALELATVFVCFSADWYLKKGGRIAVVMPRGVLFGAKQHEPFRKLHTLPRLKPVSGLDLQQVQPLFNVPSCVLIAEKANG